jgi:hypothetical protein
MARIRIGFRPIDAIFTVTDAAVERDPEFIPDVSVFWESGGGRRKAVRGYLKGLAAKRGELDQDEEDLLNGVRPQEPESAESTCSSRPVT